MKHIQRLAAAVAFSGFLDVTVAAQSTLPQDPALNADEKKAVRIMAEYNRCVDAVDDENRKAFDKAMAPHRKLLQDIEENLQHQAHVYTVAFYNGGRDAMIRLALREGHSQDNSDKIAALAPSHALNTDEEAIALTSEIFSFLKSITPIPPGPPLPHRDAEAVCEAQFSGKGINISDTRQEIGKLIEKHGPEKILPLVKTPRP